MPQITVTFPDGGQKQIAKGMTCFEIAQTISRSLAKKAISALVNGKHYDLQWPINEKCDIQILTTGDKVYYLELIRHDLAHLMARAVQELWPETKVSIGPVIENGWYYDFDTSKAINEDNFDAIEAKVKQYIANNEPVITELWLRQKAKDYFTQCGEPYKIELLEAIEESESIRMYWHGPWADLCRGPHFQRTGQIPSDAFKLMKVAGAYWRGDSSRQMLQRIYGCGFVSRKDLTQHLTIIEEAAKRDHRRLGKELDLFHFQPEAPGQAFWHPAGWRVYQKMRDYMQRRQRQGLYSKSRKSAPRKKASKP